MNNKIYSYILIGIILVSFTIRILSTNFDEFSSSDAITYNHFAWNLAHHIDNLTVIHNIGFPLFLALLFKFSSNINYTIIIQELSTIIFSCLTIPLFYKLSTRFFNLKYSLLAAGLIAFEPHMIQNSTYGITESLYIMLFVLTLVLITSKNIKLNMVSFFIAGFAMITRFEGVLLFPTMLFIYIYSNHKSRNNIIRFVLILILFIIPLCSIVYFNLHFGTHENVITSKIMHEINLVKFMSQHLKTSSHTIAHALIYLGYSSYPVFIWFIPLGFYYIIKNKPINPIFVFGLLLLLSISGTIGYFRAYDTRYFMHLYPVLSLISVYGIQQILNNNRVKNLINIIYKKKTTIFLFVFISIVCILNISYIESTQKTVLHVTPLNTIVIYPTYTLSAYDKNGFYAYYKGFCDIRCLTIPDRFDNINKITSNEYGLQTIKSFGFKIVSDSTVDHYPNILKNYDTVILLHNEYVTLTEFHAITNHPNVIYLYPNSLFAQVQNNPDHSLVLIQGHGYPNANFYNGFNWKYDNTALETQKCKKITFHQIVNGTMLNCYPESIIDTSQELWDHVQELQVQQ